MKESHTTIYYIIWWIARMLQSSCFQLQVLGQGAVTRSNLALCLNLSKKCCHFPHKSSAFMDTRSHYLAFNHNQVRHTQTILFFHEIVLWGLIWSSSIVNFGELTVNWSHSQFHLSLYLCNLGFVFVYLNLGFIVIITGVFKMNSTKTYLHRESF